MRPALVAIGTVLWSALCTAQQLEYVGNYRDIRASDTSHCYGFDLMLWKESEQRVVGLFTRYAGPCADASCSVVTGTIHEPAISFETREKVNGEVHRFVGEVNHEAIFGTLNSSQVTMNLEESSYGDSSKRRWCDNWKGVARCEGIEDYCGPSP